MRVGALRLILGFIVALTLSWSFFSYSVRSSSPEFDLVDRVSYIVDGDTFDISSGERIRLADVDTPERGEYGFYEASNFLSALIGGETVYLDVDDVYRYDTYGTRLVCVVYVEYNSTHYINVNNALLRYGYAARARCLVPILVLNGVNSYYLVWGQTWALHGPLTFLQNPPFSNLQT